MSLWTVLLFSSIAGVAIPVGASLAYLEEDRLASEPHDLHGAVIALGGGVLIGAISFVLVPEGMHRLAVGWAALAFATGTVALMLLDHAIQLYVESMGQMLAMLTDFVPETIAFGALFAGGSSGPFFAVLIALQNLPEAYSSFYEQTDADVSPGRALARLAPMALLGPTAAVLGFLYLVNDPRVVGGLVLFSAGGILYLVFEDVAPEAFHEGDWVATAAVSLGFLVALVGHGLTA